MIDGIKGESLHKAGPAGAYEDSFRGGVFVAASADDNPGVPAGTTGRGVFVVSLDDIDLHKAQTFGDFDLV